MKRKERSSFESTDLMRFDMVTVYPELVDESRRASCRHVGNYTRPTGKEGTHDQQKHQSGEYSLTPILD